MASAKDILIQKLHLAQDLLTSKKDQSLLDQRENEALSAALGIFGDTYHLNNYEDFLNKLPQSAIADYIASLESPEEQEREPLPAKEDSTIPADLETLMAQYQEAQQEQLKEDITANSVAETVKRARRIWRERDRVNSILKNRNLRQKEIDQLQSDLFFVDSVNPKAGSKKVILYQVEKFVGQTVDIQANNLGLNLTSGQKAQAIQDIIYLGLTGTVDLTNINHLNIVSQTAFLNSGAYFDSPLIKIDTAAKNINQAITTDPYSDLPQQEENKFREIVQKDREQIEEKIAQSSKKLAKILNETNSDLDDDLKNLEDTLTDIQSRLSTAIPHPQKLFLDPSPLQKSYTTLETALRQADPSLRISPTGIGARAAATLETTHSQERNISPEIVTLYSSGLTPEKFKKAEDFAKTNPNSPLGDLYKKQPDVFDQVRFQLNNLHNSKLGQEIAAKPLSGFSASITSTFNKLPPRAQNIAKFALNPTGTISTWVNRKIGQQIGNQLIKNTGSVLSQKLGNYLLKEGFASGVKTFVSEATKKLALEAAKKVGITIAGEGLTATLAVALGIPTAGASLLIAAAFFTVQEILRSTFNTVQKISKSIYGQEIETKDLVALGGIVAGGALVTTMTIFGGIRLAGAATKAALISAAGIIALTLIVIGLYLGMIFLVAPILSTLVQLDSVEKVDYSQYVSTTTSSSDCGWPTSGHYYIVTGPNGGTHHLSHLEAIDIAAPNGSPLLSATSGVVVFTGVYSNYGNTVKIQTQNSAGSFLAVYGHLSDIGVTVGQQVSQGKQIGLVGGSGGWSPHIHMEWQGIKYNQCPAGGLMIKEGCCTPYPGGICTGPCNAFSN